MADAKESKESQPVKTALNVAAYGVAGAAAVPVFRQAVKQTFYEENKGYTKYKKNKDGTPAKDTEGHLISEGRPVKELIEKRHPANDTAGHGSRSRSETLKRRAAIAKQFEKEVALCFEQDLDVKGTYGSFQALATSNKLKVAEITGAVFGIVLTTGLTVVNSGWLGKVLSHKETHKKSGTSL